MSAEWLEIIERQRREIVELGAENLRLRKELAAALEKIAALEQAAARQAAPFRRPENKKVPAEQRKPPGRKPGHEGAFRAIPKHVDHEINVPLAKCPKCGGKVSDRLPRTQYIEELPPIRPQVIRLTTWAGVCPCCGEVQSTHPLQTSVAQGAAQTMLGPRALALATLLNKHLGNTMRRTCQILRKGFGLSISPGGLSQALDRVAGKLSANYDQLIEQLRRSDAVFADETSWWVGGPGHWLWTYTNPEVTLYRIDDRRSSNVVREVLGDDFAGMLVSDCLSSYDPPPYRKHKCIAHHLKAIRQARDRPDTGATRYLDQWRLFFHTVIIIYNARQKMTPEAYAQRRQGLEAWCDRLLAEPCDKAGEVAVRERLQKQRPHLLGCLYEPAAEPTNNRAERALRPAVIARKLSCGNKTPRGSHTWQVLASLAETYTNRGIDFIDYVTQRLPLQPMQAG
jgi:transposase